MKSSIHFFFISRSVLLRMRNVSDKFVDNIKTHILCSILFFEDRTVYEIMWKNTVERGRPQMTLRRMRIACWITKATNTSSEYVILIASTLQQWLHESASILRYTYILCLLSNWDEFHIMRGTKCILKCIIWDNLHL